MNLKIKLLILFNHVAAVYGILYASPQWLWLSLIGLLLINKVGGEIGLHRYFCHNSFKTNRYWHYVLLILASLNCFGPPLAWVGVHRKHHHHSDTDADPHGAQPKWRIWSTFWKPFIIEKRYIGDMLRKPEQMFMYRWYFFIIPAIWILLFFVAWPLPIFLISIPSVLSFHLAGLVNTICHSRGVREFETKDNSYNNRFVNLITLGSGLHNTHHAKPNHWDNRTQPWDIDLPAIIIKHVLMVKEDRK